jgi:hypothetical protein
MLESENARTAKRIYLSTKEAIHQKVISTHQAGCIATNPSVTKWEFVPILAQNKGTVERVENLLLFILFVPS